MIEVIGDLRAFTALRSEWDDLLRGSASDTVFLTWEWLHSWWKHLSGGRRLALIAARPGGRLAAIAPLALVPRYTGRLRPIDTLEFLGTGLVGSDYLDLIARDGEEPAALEALGALLGHGRTMVDLAQIRKERSLAASFARLMSDRGWEKKETGTGVCPYIPLVGQSWDSYLAGLGRAHRANFRRRLRQLETRFAVRLAEAVTDDERRRFLAELVRLHIMRRSRLGGSEAFYLPGLVAFHEEFTALALRRGWLRLFVLHLDDRPAAAFYGFRYGRTFSFYQSGFDPALAAQGVGLVLMGLMIRRAILEGAEEFDFLHGDEPYKFLWTDRTRELARLRLYPKGAAASLARGIDDLSAGARTIVRRVRSESAARSTRSRDAARVR